MKRLPVGLGLGLLVVGLAGCGPLQVPMVARLDDASQKQIDEAWDQALQPVHRFDHQALLDVLLVTRAYESGVDRLTFRSEKQVTAGTVVMEVHFDRRKPAEDRFEVRLLDGAGQLIRQERYGRDEVQNTYQELFVNGEQLRQ